ncbi:S8 family serine peptidase [Clostridium sp. 'deep sea']|uniref:S8 family serine peptidase n=1 Tax=Clostridium sp. 'deep sea' TaxID=2779445 RepID=UPI0018964DC2|nr:S8 family serine peptidase [Clostridium sp. 'deep sea']QOR33935.1 S8 family serine peptidase [Clostridium sp. 'deep sea']
MSAIYKNINKLNTLNDLKKFYKESYVYPLNTIAKGELLKIAIMDSGVDHKHANLVNRLNGTFNVLTNSQVNTVDRVGHGTYIAGLIAGKEIGVLQNANLYSVKITDDDGVMSHDTVIDGIKWCIKNEIDIVCMAFGSTEYSIELHKIIKNAVNKGIILVASAGNNPQEIEYPAKLKEVICVGGIDYSLKRAKFSATGDELDIVCPSVNIPSLYSFGRFAILSGSSPATAIAVNIIGVLVHLRLKYFGTKYNVFQLRKWFTKNTIDLGEIGFDNEYGLGVPTLKYVFESLKESNYKPKMVF